MKVTVKQGIEETFNGFFDHIRRRPGDTFSIPDQPRRGLFAKEKADVDHGGEAKATYDRIKDKDGKIPSAFSFRWMEPVAASMPDRVTTSQQALDQRSDEIKMEKAGQREAETVAGDNTDVI